VAELFQKDQRHVYHAVPLLELPWLEHGFGTRRSAGWNRQPGLASLHQIHSDICLYVTGGSGRVGEGDALMTDVPGVRVGVRTADCIPILLVDPTCRAVAAVHAGWRGTAQNICSKTVAAMGRQFGSRPEELLGAVGPGIGPCCYEVGPEVAVRFRDLFPERDDLDRPAHLDLPLANRRQLLAAGLQPEHVWLARLCTFCSGDEFHSWRREGDQAGRMIAMVGVKEKRKGAG
jgi:YfiH family protein